MIKATAAAPSQAATAAAFLGFLLKHLSHAASTV